MRVSCPSCNAEASLEVLLGREVDARAVAAFIERHIVFGELVVRYIALFRPEKRRLGIARMVALVEQLLPDIERGAVNRHGRDWPAPRENWRAALETILFKRDKGAITLPLTSHGLLYEVLSGIAEMHERRHEQQTEIQRRQHRPAGPVAEAPRNLADLAANLAAPAPGDVLLVQPAPMPPDYSRPSRAALEIRARIEAHQRSRSGDAPPETGEAP